MSKKITDLTALTTPDGNDVIPVVDTSASTTKKTTAEGINKYLTTNGLLDTNGNELVKFGTTASAVNEVTITNAATGNNPQIAPTGGDTNVHLSLTGKGTGGVLTKNPYKFSVYRATAHTSSTTPKKVEFDSELFDTGSNISIAGADGTAAKGRFIAPIAGFYWFSAAAGNDVANTTTMGINLSVNGSITKYGDNRNPSRSGNLLTVSALLQLAANDYVEVFFAGGGGSSMYAGAAACYFMGYLVSAT